MIRFSTAPELHWHRHIGLYITFGVRAYRENTQLLHIPDAFCHRREAESFVDLCNAEQPTLTHVREWLDDNL